MSRFSARAGIGANRPARTRREVAPDEVRAAIVRLMLDWQESSDGDYDAYKELCRLTGRMPDPDVWGINVEREMYRVVASLEWWEVYDLIEGVLEGSGGRSINEAFVKTGVAYEVIDGAVYPFDPAGEELDVADVVHDALNAVDPHGRFRTAIAQYRKAVQARDGRPPDLEKAVAEAVNAVEAAVTIVTGEKSLSKGLKKLMPSGERKPLMDSINHLHNYASAVPGARHGAHSDSGLTDPEARYVVRAAGSALAFLITGDAEGTFPLP